MILFANDWHKYPTARPDYTTKNESFKRLVALYRDMGVKNHLFPLALIQQELVGVDPFDPSLSDDLKTKVFLECRANCWYYFREVAQFKPNAGLKNIPFKINRANAALIWTYWNHIDFLLIQPRQTGKSGSSDSVIQGIMEFWGNNNKITLITKDNSLRAANIERLKGIRDNLPGYLDFYNKQVDMDNTEGLTIRKWNNTLVTGVAQASAAGADKLGRGMSTATVIVDEFAYIHNIHISLPVALSAGTAAKDQARDAKQPYGNIYLTTAGNIDTPAGRYAYDFMMGGTNWTERMLDCENNEQLKDMVRKNAGQRGRMLINGVFNHRQLGYSDSWVYEKIQGSVSGRELAERDYLNIWTTGAEGSPLDEQDKIRLKDNLRDPDFTEISKEGYILRWYVPREKIASRMANSSYVMGLDTSDALGGNNDAIGMVIIDTKTHDVVATGRYNETSIQTFAFFLTDLLVRYPSITLNIERKSSGKSILDIVTHRLVMLDVDPFKRIYNQIVDEPHLHQNEWNDISRPLNRRSPGYLERYARFFGFVTSGSGKHARDKLYNQCLHDMLRKAAHRIYDKDLIQELFGIQTKNGRIDHASNQHDDLVIGLLLGNWLCINGKNLRHYGIEARSVFSNTEDLGSTTPEERFAIFKRNQFKLEIERLLEELNNAETPTQVIELENRLKFISSKGDIEEVMGNGIDALLEQAREQKRHKTIERRRSDPQRSIGGLGSAVPRRFQQRSRSNFYI